MAVGPALIPMVEMSGIPNAEDVYGWKERRTFSTLAKQIFRLAVYYKLSKKGRNWANMLN